MAKARAKIWIAIESYNSQLFKTVFKTYFTIIIKIILAFV